MRRIPVLRMLALLLALGAGVFFYWENRAPGSRLAPLEAIARAKQSFLENRKPEGEIDLSGLAQNRYHTELVQPESALPQSQNHELNDVVALYRYAEECKGAPGEGMFPVELKKTLTWHRFRCGELKSLPDKFFETPPFMHPSGESFVRLAERSGRKEFRDGPWRETHSAYLHVSELDLGFSRRRLIHLLAESPMFTDDNLVFFRQKKEGMFSSASRYTAYPRAAWANHLEKLGLQTTVWKAQDWCLLKEGNVCWRDRSLAPHPVRRFSLLLLLGSLVLLAFTLLALVVQKLRMRAKERQARLFALQTLTHELRTPATTLALGVEGLKREFDFLPPAAQTELLRMGDEIQRLGRVLQASTQYVKSHRDPRHIQFQYADIESVNEYFGALLEPYQGKIEFHPLEKDRGAKLDRYWLGLCVKNLVDNALSHGKPPVVVRLTPSRPGILIQVSDAGSVSQYGLEDLMGGLSREASSPGLGIGLSIVARVVRLMKGKLTLSPSPTTFSLWLRSPA